MSVPFHRSVHDQRFQPEGAGSARGGRLLGAAALLVAVLLPAPQAEARNRFFPGRAYPDGEIILVTGLVTDSHGTPLADVDVALEGTRRELQARKLRFARVNPVRAATRTNEHGEYTIRWRWHHYYNRFRVLAGINDRGPGGVEALVELAEVDLSNRILQGSPAVANVTIVDRTFIDRYRDFIAALDSPDEKQTYEQMGRPNKVETLRFPDREEVSWWYWNQGKTYRFVDGRIDHVVDFDPISGGPTPGP